MISDDIIHEAQNYEVMFNDILKIDTNPRLRQEITRDINWARKTLRKNDRIIWFLRWSKIWYQLSGGIWAGGRANTSLSAALQQYNQRFQTRYVAGDLRSPPVMKTQLEHFLSMPIPEIQNYVFRTESPRQLFELFTKYEAAWRQRIEEEKSLITPEPEDEILISFADGYAWWLLPRGGCRVEAEAMGHCGNVPSQRPGDQILSLRRQVRLDLRSRATPQGGLRGEAPTEGSTRGDVIRWYPVATFILDDDGKLGEMKGRGNDKPAAKYHPYIVELLRHHLIRGIKGGGYMPENNFSISDLDPQTREQLIAAKPELKGLLGYYEEEGMTERVLDMLETSLHERDLPDYERFDPVKRDFILSTYRDLAHFVSTNGDDILEQLLELRERALELAFRCVFCESDPDGWSSSAVSRNGAPPGLCGHRDFHRDRPRNADCKTASRAAPRILRRADLRSHRAGIRHGIGTRSAAQGAGRPDCRICGRGVVIRLQLRVGCAGQSKRPAGFGDRNPDCGMGSGVHRDRGRG